MQTVLYLNSLCEILKCTIVGRGHFISSNMEFEARDPLTKSARRARVWKCKLCDFSGAQNSVALHIHEIHQ